MPRKKATHEPESPPAPSEFFAEAAQVSGACLVDLPPVLSRAYEAAGKVLRDLKYFGEGPLPALTGGPLGMATCQLHSDLDELRGLIRGELGARSAPDADFVQILNLTHGANVALYQLRVAERALTTWDDSAKGADRQRVPPATLRQFEAAVERLKGELLPGGDPAKLTPPPRVDVRSLLDGGLRLAPGGFLYGGQFHNLTGRPLQMLTALLDAPFGRMTADELRKVMAVDDEAVEFPEQVVKDAAKALRASLRQAAEAIGRPVDNPLPSSGRGADLTYSLNMP
jgi:hypothetical protein